MAGVQRGQTIAPPRRNVSLGNCAPEWREYWEGLDGAWLFDELGGELVADRSGNGLNVDSNNLGAGAPTWFGGGAQFDGVTGNILQGPQRDYMDNFGPVTLLCFFTKSSTWNVDFQSPAMYGGSNHEDSPWGMTVAFNEISFFHMDDFSMITPANWNASGEALDVPHVCVVTRDPADDVRLYFNGVLKAGPTADTLTGTTETSGTGMTIGASRKQSPTDTIDHHWDGVIYAVLVWNRALTDAEVHRISLDPYAPFRPWRAVKVATGGTTHQLSGSLATSFALSAGLEVRRAVAGTLPLALAPRAGLNVRHAVAGTLPLALAPSGAFDVRRALAGTVPLLLAPGGRINVRRALDGTLALTLQLSGGLLGTPAVLGDLAVADAALGGLAASDAALGGIALSDATYGHLEVSDGE